MKKDLAKSIVVKALLGIPIGITIGFLIPIAISLFIGDGNFYPAVPEFIQSAGSELSAVVTQTALCGVMGAIISAFSYIWRIDAWSLLKRSAAYFAILAASMLIPAYICRWMRHSAVGVAIFAAIFVGIFVLVWLINYFINKQKIKRINCRLEKQ